MNSNHAHNRPVGLLCGAAMMALHLTALPATLVNRYSFTTDAGDSVGGQNGVLVNDAFVSNGNVVLDGGSQQYVDLPNNLVAQRTSITIEVWVTPGYNGNWTRIWDFGNSNTGEGQSGYGVKHFMIYILPNLEATIYAGGTDSWIRSAPARTLDVDVESHVVWTSNGTTRKARLYVNGVLVGKNAAADNTCAKMGSTFNNWLGRSQFSADPYFSGAINEFRIWDGALTPLEVAASLKSGPDDVNTDPGAITGLTLQAAFEMTRGNSQQAVVLASASNLSEPIDVADIVSYQSGNTAVLTVNANGLIRAVAAGSTTVTATYQDRSASQTITVVERPAQLTHRYSFTTDAGDSAGSAHGTLLGGASISSGQVVLNPAAESLVQLPSGTIAGYQAVTIETWASFDDLGTWSRVWSFGEQNDGGAGRYYIELCPHGGAGDTYISISDADPGGSHADAVARPGSLDNQNDVHIAAVFNPLGGYHALYINGSLAGYNANPTVQLSGVKDTLNWIGRSLYAADPYLSGKVDEFRIYRGPLSSLEIAVSRAAGPDTVKRDAGALQSITLQLPATMTIESGVAPAVLATYANLTNFNLTANSLGPVLGLTYSFSDTNVLHMGDDGLVHSGRDGSAQVTASYQGKTSTATVTLTQPPAATLVHRYSFDANVNDSVGTAHGALQGAAKVQSGKLVLNGSDGTYVELPGGLVASLESVTFEFWVDFRALANWCRVFDFGTTSGNNGANFIFFSPKTHFGAHRFGIATGAGYSDLDGAGTFDNRTMHIVCVYDPASGFHGVYTDGVLEVATYNARVPLNTVATDFSFVGRSLFAADGYLNASIDELRIYEGRLTSDGIASNFRLGPDRMAGPKLAIVLSGGNAILTWPAGTVGFTLETTAELGVGANWTSAGTPTVEGGLFKVTVPVTGTRFYRLRK